MIATGVMYDCFTRHSTASSETRLKAIQSVCLSAFENWNGMTSNMSEKKPYDTPRGLPDTDAILRGSTSKKICFSGTGLLLYTTVVVIAAYVVQAFIYASNTGTSMW